MLRKIFWKLTRRKEKTGNDPRKQNNIGCSLKPAEEIESLG